MGEAGLGPKWGRVRARGHSPKERLDRMGLRAQDVAGCTMILHRAFARRRGPRGPFVSSTPRLLRVASLIGLSVLLGGLVLPVASLVLARGSAPVCCSKGRCCCADDSVARDERTCLRRGCGCEHGGQAVTGEPLGVEAVLSSPVPVAAPPRAEVRWALPDQRPIARAQTPAPPPPKRSLPA